MAAILAFFAARILFWSRLLGSFIISSNTGNFGGKFGKLCAPELWKSIIMIMNNEKCTNFVRMLIKIVLMSFDCSTTHSNNHLPEPKNHCCMQQLDAYPHFHLWYFAKSDPKKYVYIVNSMDQNILKESVGISTRSYYFIDYRGNQWFLAFHLPIRSPNIQVLHKRSLSLAIVHKYWSNYENMAKPFVHIR